ncbi:MAG: hypothetical protein LQ346_003896 [Caloplaca aetnensis]|nr:MAG: hypothetical protein LQ346_003896 [Caloplaca aetnensis]
MSGKGFADLRAKFENQTNDTSPPSRGRSPAGQDYVTGSANQKIRTSFVSVERSGQMGPSVDHRESLGSNEERVPVVTGPNGTKEGMNGEAMDSSKSNGVGAMPDASDLAPKLGDDEGGSKASMAGNRNLAPDEATKEDAVNPDKPATAGEDDVPPMQPSDPKDEEAVSGGAALAPRGESLGALLKGPEFEAEGNKTPKKASPKKSSVPSQPSTPNKPRSPQKPTPAQSKLASTPKMNGSPRAKQGPSRTSPVKKAEEPPVATPEEFSATKSTENSTSVTEESPNPPQTPTSPSASKTPKKDLSAESVSPKQTAPPKDSTQQAGDDQKKKAANQKPSRPSIAAKTAPPAVSRTTKPRPSVAASIPKASKPSSPIIGKPRPKSPTRPVRLPGAATASTAASAAKTGATATSQPSSKTSPSNPAKPSTSGKPAGTQIHSKPAQPTASVSRNKAPRSSLPASTADQKPKPRMSTASTKASGGDFLARMMRPTQASASKTHDKVEQKTPPKKRVSSRPKRISDEDSEPTASKSMPEKPTQTQAAPEPVAEEKEDVESNFVDPKADVAEEGNKEISPEEVPEPSTDEAGQQSGEPVFGS